MSECVCPGHLSGGPPDAEGFEKPTDQTPAPGRLPMVVNYTRHSLVISKRILGEKHAAIWMTERKSFIFF